MSEQDPHPRLPFRTIFTAYALIIVGVGIVVLLLLSQTVREQVLQQAQREATLVARLLASEFTRYVDRQHTDMEHVRRSYRQLDRLYRLRARDQGVAWMKVYAADGRILYSPNKAEVGTRTDEDGQVVLQTLQQGPVVHLIRTADEPDLADQGLPPWLVEVYVPLPPDSEPFRVFEIYLDVTPYLERAEGLRWRIAGTMILGAVVLFGLLVYITRRSYAIIERQVHELAEAHAALQRLEAHKRGLINMVVHDLKNLLGVMLGHAELLAMHAEGEQRAWARDMLQAGRHMHQMMQDMLDVARLEERTFPVALQAVRLDEVVPDAVASFCRWAEEQGKTCQLALSADLPPVQADPAVLARVVQNLAGNALHHARTTVRVETRAHPEGGLLLVQDDGEGIAAEHLTRIFDPYYRVPGTRRRGAGLGLAFCQRAVEAMGGRLWVESTVGQGTTFYVWLPRAS